MRKRNPRAEGISCRPARGLCFIRCDALEAARFRLSLYGDLQTVLRVDSLIGALDGVISVSRAIRDLHVELVQTGAHDTGKVDFCRRIVNLARWQDGKGARLGGRPRGQGILR